MSEKESVSRTRKEGTHQAGEGNSRPVKGGERDSKKPDKSERRKALKCLKGKRFSPKKKNITLRKRVRGIRAEGKFKKGVSYTIVKGVPCGASLTRLKERGEKKKISRWAGLKGVWNFRRESYGGRAPDCVRALVWWESRPKIVKVSSP